LQNFVERLQQIVVAERLRDKPLDSVAELRWQFLEAYAGNGKQIGRASCRERVLAMV
jgi:hypothetical protein